MGGLSNYSPTEGILPYAPSDMATEENYPSQSSQQWKQTEADQNLSQTYNSLHGQRGVPYYPFPWNIIRVKVQWQLSIIFAPLFHK